MKTVLMSLVLLVLFLAGVLVVASLYFYDVAIKRSKKDFLVDNEDLKNPENNQEATQRERWDWLAGQTLELWQITSEEGLNLVGYYLAAGSPTSKTVILAHGYTSQGHDMESFAWFYRDILGFNVLMPDARGHGQSQGDYIGFGWHERKDYVLWIQRIIDKLGDDVQIALHGISMGGATVMMVSGEELPSQVKVIVEDCGYTSAYEELAYQLKRMYKLPPFPILPATSVVAKLRAGYSLYEASALKQVEKTHLPVLFIHGDDDRFVPTEMVYRLYEACQSEKEIYIVQGAGHGHAYGTDRTAYVQKVGDFVGRFIN
jgi:hypothetical protein